MKHNQEDEYDEHIITHQKKKIKPSSTKQNDSLIEYSQ